jgi:hypothetical protein
MSFWNKIKRNKIETIGDVKVRYEKPPIWDNVCIAFGIKPVNVYFTYGDTIYNPDKLEIPVEIIEHEKVHMEQQNHNDTDAAIWWGKYLRDPIFRIDQEARAYGQQYKTYCSVVSDKNQRARYLFIIARSLSGPLYQNSISHSEAINLIRKFSGIPK